MLSGELGTLTERQRDAVIRLRELTRYATSLMTNLRQLSQLQDEPSLLALEAIEVPAFVRSVCRDLAVEAKRKKVRLAAVCANHLPPLWAERDSLTQVLINLIYNAIKYTRGKGRVTVSATQSRGMIRFEIQDTGAGIAPEALPKLFHEFYHEDKPEVGAVGGTGLGLAIVKRIVDRHQGEVSVTSRLGQGSTFRVVLPLRTGLEVVQDLIEQLIHVARPRRESFTVVVLETRGPAAGTVGTRESLQERVERVVQETIRREDRCIRLRQGRLIAVLARTTLEGARLMVQRLSERLQRDTVLHRHPQFQIWIGLAAYPKHARQGRQLLQAACAKVARVSLDGEAAAHVA